MLLSRRAAMILISAVVAGSAAPLSHAGVIYYWDLNQGTANSGSSATGNWNGSTQNWNNSSTGGAGTFTASPTADDDLVFSSSSNYTSGTITVTAGRVAGSLKFEEGALTLSGGSITLGGGASASTGITVNSGVGATSISSSLTLIGNQSFTQNSASAVSFSGSIDAGTNNVGLTLAGTGNGAINITGGLTTGSGTLTISKSGTNGVNINTGTLSLGSGGLTLASGAQTPTISAPVTLTASQTWTNNSSNLLTVSNSITNSTNTLAIAGTGNVTLSGVLGSGSGGLIMNGSGTLALSNTNTYSGATIVNKGYVDVSGSIASSSGITIATGATLELVAGNLANKVSNSAQLTMKGGTFFFSHGSGNNQFAETIGVLVISQGASAVSANTNNSSGGSKSSELTFASLSRTVGATVNFVSATGTLSAGDDNNNINFTSGPTLVGGIVGGYATVDLTDWATYTTGSFNSIEALATYNTSTTVSAWAATDNVSLAASPATNITASKTINTMRFTTNAPTVTISAAQTLTLTAGGLMANSNSTPTITGGIVQGAAGTDLVVHQNSSNTFTIASQIVNNTSATGLTKDGTGLLVISNTNNTYSGNTYVLEGTLRLSAASGNNNISASPKIWIDSGATLDVSTVTAGFQVVSGQTLSGYGSVSGATTVASGGILNPGDVSAVGTLSTAGLTFNSGSHFAAELDGATADRATVTGTATLGGNLDVTILNAPTLSSYTILTSTTNVTGTFSNLNAANRVKTTDGSKTYHVTINTGAGGSVVLDNALNPATIAIAPGVANINKHVGTTATVSIFVGNTATGGSDTLNYTLTGNVTGSGTRAAGDANAAAGVNVTANYAVGSTGVNNLSATATDPNATNSPQTANFTVTGYALASTTFNTTSITQGPVHTGGSFGTQALSIDNTLAANTFHETLGAQFASPSGVNTSGSPITVVAGAAANTSMAVGLSASTAIAGPKSGSVQVTFNSQAVNSSGLGTTNLPGLTKTINLAGDVYDYANPLFSGGGITVNAGSASSPFPAFNTNYSLDFGSFNVGSGTQTLGLTLANSLITNASFQDALNGGYVMSGSGAFAGWTSFSDIAANFNTSPLNITFDTSGTVGLYTGTLTFTPVSKNGAGLGNTPMTDIVINLSGTLTSSSPAAFDITSPASITLSVLKGAGGGSLSNNVTVTNNGGAAGSATLSLGSVDSNLSPTSPVGSINAGNTGTGSVSLNTSAYASGSNTVNASPAGSSPSININYNVGNATAAEVPTLHDHATVGSALSAQVNGGSSYGTLSSKVVVSDDEVGSEAILIGGTASNTTTVTMKWRERNADEMLSSYSNPPVQGAGVLISDVVQIEGTGSDAYVLKVSYTWNPLDFGGVSESTAISNGWIRLMYLDPMSGGLNDGSGVNDDQWRFAADTTGGFFNYMGDHVPVLGDGVGSFGVDTSGATHYAWAILDHGGQFAAVPEPTSLSLLGLGAVGLLKRRRR